MVGGRTLYVDLFTMPTGTIVDDGGAEGSYSNSFNGTVVITAMPGLTITLTGSYNTESCCDHITVTDMAGNVLADASGSSTLSVSTNSGMMSVHFETDGSVVSSGFSLNWSTSGLDTICTNSVSDLTVSGVTTTGATLSWSAANGAGPFLVILSQGGDGGVVVGNNVTATTYNLTGLNPDSYYDVLVIAAADTGCRYCGSRASLRTQCGVASLPYSEGFEGLPIGSAVPCWTTSLNFDDGDWQPRLDALHTASGERSFSLTCGSTATAGHFGMLVSPNIDLSAGPCYLSFAMQGSHSGTAVVVGLCDSTSSEYASFGFEPIDTIYTSDVGWQNYRIQFTAPAGKSRLAWRMVQGMQAGTGRRIYLDDIAVTGCGIATLSTQYVEYNQMDVVWTTFGSTTVTIGVRHVGAAVDEMTFNAATSPLTVTGLEAETYYEVRAYPECSGGGLPVSTAVLTSQAPTSASGLCLDLSRPNQVPEGWSRVITGSGSLNIGNNMADAYGKVYLISSELSGLPGTTFELSYDGEVNSASTIAIGTCLYDGDTTGFTPFQVVTTTGDRTTIAVTVPASAVGSHLALRFNSQYGWTLRLYDIHGTTCPVTGVKVVHRLGTSVVLRWDPVAPGDTVLVRHWLAGGSESTAVTDTVIGRNGAMIGGLSPFTGYNFMVYGSCTPPCPGNYFEVTTQHQDYPMPYCDGFDTLNEVHWIYYSGDWDRGRVFGDCPQFSSQPYYYGAGRALQMASFGFAWDYYSTAVLPDMLLDTGSIVSFYATSLAPQGYLLLSVRHTASFNTWYDVFDTIYLTGGSQRTHYTAVVPDSIVGNDGRLAISFRHTDEYHLYRCYIDELNIGTMAYGTANVAAVDSTSAGLTLTGLVGDSVRITIYTTGSTPVGTYTFALPLPDTLMLDGLNPGTLYRYYVQPMGDGTGCQSYAGYFVTPMTMEGSGASGGGDPLANCFDFNELLSWELPAGWAFTGINGTDPDASVVSDYLSIEQHTLATIYASPRSGQVFSLRARSSILGDTLLLGLVDTAIVPNGMTVIDTSVLSLAGVPAYRDTIVLDTAWHYFAVKLPTAATAARHVAMLSGNGTLDIDDIVFSQCAIPDFEIQGDNIIFTAPGGGTTTDYVLNITGDSGELRYYHITSSPFRIAAGLRMNTTYDIHWQCAGSWAECDPAITLSTGGGVPLPYCLRYDDFSSVSVPSSWLFALTANGHVMPSNYYGPSLRLQSGDGRRQYAILPVLMADSVVSLRFSGHNSCQLGYLASGTDTATFVPVVDFEDWWIGSRVIDLSAYADKRLAIRTTSYFDLMSLEVYDMSMMHYALVAGDKLKVWTDAPDDYYVDLYYDYWHSLDTLAHVSRNPDTILVRENREIYVRQLPDATTVMCSNNYSYFTSGKVMALPYCVNCVNYSPYGDYMSNFYSYDDLRTFARAGEGTFYFVTNGNRLRWATFQDIAVDSLRHASLMLRYHSTRQGVPIIVGVLDDALDTSTFTPVDTLLTDAGEGWQYGLFELANYTGAGRWLHIRVGSTSTNDTVFIRNFNIEPCHASMGTTASLTRWNTVTIDNRLTNSSDIDFFMEYGTSGFSLGNGTIVHITSLPMDVTLEPETMYNFYFRCDSLGSSCTEMQSVKTLAAPLAVPSCSAFDTASVGSNLRGWNIYGSTASITDTFYHTAGRSLRIPVSQSALVVSPDIDLDTVQRAAISLWMTADNADSRLQVGVVESPSLPSTFHLLRSVATPQAGTWVRSLIDLSTAPAGARFIAFRTIGSSTSGAGSVYLDDMFIDTCAAFGLGVSSLDASSVTFGWSQTGHPDISVTMMQGDSLVGTYSPDSAGLTVAGLSPFVGYTFLLNSSCGDTSGYCNLASRDTITIVTPGEGTGCIDATNLNSPQAVFFSGTFSNPYSAAGAVNYGALEAGSRHTVCYDTSYRDPRTGGMLRAIPEGYTSSVRLGNWTSSAWQPEAEGVVYSLMVDTNDFSILLLRYAAVLQDPMHAAEDQPRFRLEILDSSFNLIDPVCAAADFVADQTLGWNTAADNVLWKDWTPVGIDLSSYNGQQVYVRLTTFDCNEGSHYGYAYFTLECMRMQLSSDTCGAVDSNTFTAPAGFNYRWYTSANPATFSTAQSITVPSTPVTYYCELSGIGNSSCNFTVSVWGGDRLPLAAFDTTVTIVDCQFHVDFHNNSVISSDGVNVIPGSGGCESAQWDFGNGQGSTAYHAQTVYTSPGTYTVTLVSGIAHNRCTDTATLTFTLDFPPGVIPTDTVQTTICDNQNYSFYGTNYVTSGTFYASTSISGSFCDSVHVLDLTVFPTSKGDTTATACDTFYWRGIPFSNHAYSTLVLDYPLASGVINSYGCDSVIALQLTLYSSHDTTVIDTVVQNDLPYSVAGALVNYSQLSTVNEQLSTFSGHYSTQTSAGCDSTVNLQLAVWVNRDTAFDTTVCRNLLPLVYHGHSVADAGMETVVIPTTHGADSIVALTVNVIENPSLAVYDTTVENMLPHVWRGITFTDNADTTLTLLNAVGCDSLVYYSLTVWHNQQVRLVADICDDTLPYLWDGYTFANDDSVTFTLTDSHGADSTVTLVVYVHPTYVLPDTHIICPWRPFEYEGIDYGGPVVFDMPHFTVYGCDSLVHVVLTPRDSTYRPLVVYSNRDTAWLTADTIIFGCAPDTLHLLDSSEASVAWLWSFNNGDTIISDTTREISILFQQYNSDDQYPPYYNLITTDTNGCFDTLNHPVYIFRSPTAVFDWNPSVPAIDNPEAQFYNHSLPWSLLAEHPGLIGLYDTLNFLWSIQRESGGSVDTTTELEPFYHWGNGENMEGDYAVTLVAYWTQRATDTSIVHTCVDTADNIVTITNDYLQFPNLVTPNGDGSNDTWRIVNLLEYGNYPVNELWIYNQWGVLVYHAVNISTEGDFWDPNATASPDGTYFFRFTARSLYGLAKRNGVIEVLR